MKTVEIKEQLVQVLRNDIINKISPNEFEKLDPRYPFPKEVFLTPNNIKLTDDQNDCLRDGGIIELNCEINGKYTKANIEGESISNIYINVWVNPLKLKITNDKLEIVEINCYVSPSRY